MIPGMGRGLNPRQLKMLMKEDIQLVMDQTGVSRERAIEALKATSGSPAEAILKIMEEG